MQRKKPISSSRMAQILRKPLKFKKNVIMRAAYLLLAMVLMLTALVGGTYAKYSQVLGAKDTARVAYFHVDTEEDFEEKVINIFDSAYTGDGEFADQNTVEADHRVVAPGTQGAFDVVIFYGVEVDCEYSFKFTETQTPVDANIPIVYSIDNGATWFDVDDVPQVLQKNEIKAGNGDFHVHFMWKWEYEDYDGNVHEQDDTHDTNLGFASSAEVQLQIALNVTQID